MVRVKNEDKRYPFFAIHRLERDKPETATLENLLKILIILSYRERVNLKKKIAS